MNGLEYNNRLKELRMDYLEECRQLRVKFYQELQKLNNQYKEKQISQGEIKEENNKYFLY